MIIGKTTSGFSFKIKKRVFHSMKVNKLIVKFNESPNTKEVLDVIYALLGKEQADAFLDHCDSMATDDKFGDEICNDGFAEIFEALNNDRDVKN